MPIKWKPRIRDIIDGRKYYFDIRTVHKFGLNSNNLDKRGRTLYKPVETSCQVIVDQDHSKLGTSMKKNRSLIALGFANFITIAPDQYQNLVRLLELQMKIFALVLVVLGGLFPLSGSAGFLAGKYEGQYYGWFSSEVCTVKVSYHNYVIKYPPKTTSPFYIPSDEEVNEMYHSPLSSRYDDASAFPPHNTAGYYTFNVCFGESDCQSTELRAEEVVPYVLARDSKMINLKVRGGYFNEGIGRNSGHIYLKLGELKDVTIFHQYLSLSSSRYECSDLKKIPVGN